MKGIEGLPFRYVILALVAILVVGIVIQINKMTTKGINTVTGEMTKEINSQITGQFDTKGPEINSISVSYIFKGFCITTKLYDESGIKKAIAFVDIENSKPITIYLKHVGDSGKYEVWKGCKSTDEMGNAKITVWAMDNSPHENENTQTITHKI